MQCGTALPIASPQEGVNNRQPYADKQIGTDPSPSDGGWVADESEPSLHNDTDRKASVKGAHLHPISSRMGQES
jgi:hypothetical protein